MPSSGVEKCYREERCQRSWGMPINVAQPCDSHTANISQLQLGNPVANSGGEENPKEAGTQIMHGKMGKVPTLAEMCCKYAAAASKCQRNLREITE